MRERRHVGALGALAHRSFEFCGGRRRITQRQVCRRDQAGLVRAELADPAVVRLGVRLRQFGIVELGLPQQTDRRVEHGGIDALGVEQTDAVVGIHRPERRLGQVGPRRILDERHEIGLTHRPE